MYVVHGARSARSARTPHDAAHVRRGRVDGAHVHADIRRTQTETHARRRTLVLQPAVHVRCQFKQREVWCHEPMGSSQPAAAHAVVALYHHRDTCDTAVDHRHGAHVYCHYHVADSCGFLRNAAAGGQLEQQRH